MTIKKDLQLNGLWTYRDTYSNKPEGAMLEADNVNLDKLNIASPRVGFETKFQSAAPVGTSFANMFNYGNKLVVSSITQPSISTDVVSFATLPTMTALTSPAVPPPIGALYHSFAAAGNNLYFTSQSGVMSYNGTGYARQSGVTDPGTPVLSTYISGATTAWTKKQMAYRVLFFTEDSNGRRYVGAPSPRVWIARGDANEFGVYITVRDPSPLLPPNSYMQVYRTKTLPYNDPVGVIDDVATDEMFLVYETKIISGTFSIPVVDFTADSYLGAALYTNTSQEGIQQANDIPPLASVIELYQGRLLFGNVKTPATTVISLVSQLQNNARVSLLYTQVGGAVTTTNFDFYTGSPPSPPSGSTALVQIGTSDDVIIALQQTMDNWAAKMDILNIIRATRETEGAVAQIRVSIDPLYAYLYNKLTIQSADSIAAASFSPPVPTSSPLIATETVNLNRVMYSKADEPEAVPAMNYNDVGDPTEAIIAIKTLRDKAIIVKERSVWKLTGGDPLSFSFQLMDGTTSVVDGRTVQSLANKVYALSLQGIVSISESVQIVSRRITDLLVDKSGEATAWVDEEHGLYIVNPSLSTNSQLIVYNYLNDNYTSWSFADDSVVNNKDSYTPHMGITINSRMVLGVKTTYDYPSYTASIPVLRCQRWLWSSDLAYGDENLYVKYSSITDGVITFIAPTGTAGGSAMSNGISYLAPGVKMYQMSSTGQLTANGGVYQVLSVTVSGGNALVTASVLANPVIADPVQNTDVHYRFFKPSIATMTFWPFIGEGIETYKEFTELAIVSNKPVSGQITATFTTDLNPQSTTYTIASANTVAGWGGFPWGGVPWGGNTIPANRVERLLVPAYSSKAHELNTTITVQSNLQKWEISGISYNFRGIGFTPNNRGDK